ncbi:hypothetical protein O6H91_08G047000 [Diphasiastrum complanatum]|uniref:Uncharacterized protein n=3 Tax=Diphasiastrum complanatum TaxID=34168 RepID=A0ACC2CX37_DIPCM|nr:hypothetical protein O6H91_08G047000 [Diphasiastrum complanatum]
MELFFPSSSSSARKFSPHDHHAHYLAPAASSAHTLVSFSGMYHKAGGCHRSSILSRSICNRRWLAAEITALDIFSWRSSACISFTVRHLAIARNGCVIRKAIAADTLCRDGTTAIDPQIVVNVEPSTCSTSNGFAVVGLEYGTELDPSEDDQPNNRKTSGRQRRKRVAELMNSGLRPIEVLENMGEWIPAEFWGVVDFLHAHHRTMEAVQIFYWWMKQEGYRGREEHFVRFMNMVGMAKMPDIAQQIFDEMENVGLKPTATTFTCLIHVYAENHAYEKSQDLLEKMSTLGLKPNVVTYSGLIHFYGRDGCYDEMARMFNIMRTIGCSPNAYTYRSLIRAYAHAGLIARMEKAFEEMISEGWPPDSSCINLMVQAKAVTVSLTELGNLYELFKKYRILIREPTIRAMAIAFIRASGFYQLGQFVRQVGLRRPNVGNLLWNLLLLSYASNFSMKNLQREFQNMKEAGFEPDLTTFNIRAMAFSRMQMFWDLHVTVLHMQSMSVMPDLITYGAVVDAYVAGNLQPKLSNALKEMQMFQSFPEVRTDEMVFEAFGLGDFHKYCTKFLSSEEGNASPTSYRTLTMAYLDMK